MKIFRFIYITLAQAYYNKACAHNPLHPDLPMVMRRRLELQDAHRKLFV